MSKINISETMRAAAEASAMITTNLTQETIEKLGITAKAAAETIQKLGQALCPHPKTTHSHGITINWHQCPQCQHGGRTR